MDDNCEINAIDPTTIETEDSTSQTGGNSGADCNRLGYLGYLVDPDSHSNPVRRLIITGSLDDLMSGLFPPIFVDAPVAGISYLPIFDGDDDSPQLVSVSNLSESGGGFRPNGASQVLFALGAISLSSGGPIESSLSFDAHLLPVLFANDFEGHNHDCGDGENCYVSKGSFRGRNPERRRNECAAIDFEYR